MNILSRFNFEQADSLALHPAKRSERLSLVSRVSFNWQPIVNLSTGGVEYYEVLSRFITPDQCSVQSHIEKIEDSGMATELGKRNLASISHFLRDSAFAAGVPCAINISAESVQNRAFIFWFDRFVTKNNLNNGRLMIEITETQPVTNFDAINLFIEMANFNNIKVSLDDIGSGFMQKDIISKINADKIKLDGSIVRKCVENVSFRSEVLDIVEIAKGRNCTVIAEHIENRKVLSEMKKLGCDSGQGYCLGKPSNTPECPNIVQSRHRKLINGSKNVVRSDSFSFG